MPSKLDKGKFAEFKGTEPDNRLKETLNLLKWFKSKFGMAPVNLFWLARKVSRPEISDRFDGRSPEKLLLEMSSFFKFLKLEIEEARRLPENRLLPRKRLVRLEQYEISGGSFPVMELKSRFSTNKELELQMIWRSRPSTEPLRLSELRSMNRRDTNPSSHEIPLHPSRHGSESAVQSRGLFGESFRRKSMRGSFTLSMFWEFAEMIRRSKRKRMMRRSFIDRRRLMS